RSYDQMYGAPGTTQAGGDLLVVRRQSDAAIDEEQQHIGLLDGTFGLLRHLVHDAALGDRVETGRVDDEVVMVTDPADAVMPVTRETGQVRDKRVAGAGQPVEQGRLADVGASDEDDGGFHCGLFALF